MYHPTTRVLTVLELLQARGRLSGPELAERLEVDLRTVRRYVTMLQDLGIPVEAARGRHGGYRLRPGFRLPPLVFSDDEALALTLGLMSARRLGSGDRRRHRGRGAGQAGARAAARRARPRVRRPGNPHHRPDPRRADPHHRHRHGPGGGRPRLAPRAPALRLGAGRRDRAPGRALRAGARRPPLVRAGLLPPASGLRLFRLDRIRAVDLLEDAFVRPADFDPLRFVQDALAVAPSAWHVEAVLDTTLDRARQVIPPHEATIEPGGDGVVLRLNVGVSRRRGALSDPPRISLRGQATARAASGPARPGRRDRAQRRDPPSVA